MRSYEFRMSSSARTRTGESGSSGPTRSSWFRLASWMRAPMSCEFAECDDAHHHAADCADARPDCVGRSHWNCFHGNGQKPHAQSHTYNKTTSASGFLKPFDILSAVAQTTSNKPATISISQFHSTFPLSFQQSQAESVLESKIAPLRIRSSTSASERTTGCTFSSGSWSCAWAVSESSAK